MGLRARRLTTRGMKTYGRPTWRVYDDERAAKKRRVDESDEAEANLQFLRGALIVVDAPCWSPVSFHKASGGGC
jgi:hypothetical protein